MAHETFIKNGLVVEGGFQSSGSLEGSSSYALDADKWIYNDLLEFLKAQTEKTRSVYQIPGIGVVDDYVDLSGSLLTGSWFRNDASSLIYNPTPISASTTLLLHFETIQGTSTTVDSSIMNHQLTGSFYPLMNNSASKFGTGSAFFSGSGINNLIVFNGNNRGFNFPVSESFTVELFLSCSSVVTGSFRNVIMNAIQNDASEIVGWRVFVTPTSSIEFAINVGTGSNRMATTSSVANGAWNHVAVVRSGSNANNLSIYVNGVKEASMTYHDSLTASLANGKLTASLYDVSMFRIGMEYPIAASNPYFGYLDEIRVIRGWPVYSGSSFTPPNAQLSDGYLRNGLSPNNLPNPGAIDSTNELRSKPVGLAYVPDKARAILVARVASGSFNDFSASVSRDGGATFSNLPFLAQVTWSVPNTFVYSATTDLRSQPIASNVVYKITTNVTSSRMVIEGIAFDFQ